MLQFKTHHVRVTTQFADEFREKEMRQFVALDIRAALHA
jgi:hypothetical protein